jgi:hypothetical protein
MRHFDGDRHPVDQHDLVRPIELVRLAGRKAQRYIGFCRRGTCEGGALLFNGSILERDRAFLSTFERARLK